MVEAGIDPRVIEREAKTRDAMTVDRAHGLYMEAVMAGRSSRAKKANKPRTIKDKLSIYTRDIAPKLGRLTPHDFRRTARSNTKRLKVDYETAEAMLNHVKKGLERTYDLYELEEEKRRWFLTWEDEVIAIARKAGVAKALGVPQALDTMSHSLSFALPQGSGQKPLFNLGAQKARANVKLTRTTAKIVFSRETSRAPLP